MRKFAAAVSRHAVRRWRAPGIRRWTALAGALLLLGLLAPGCRNPGLEAGAATVVTIERDTPIHLVGSNADKTRVTFSLSAPVPAHGQLTGTPPDVVYRPAAGFLGTDKFGFTVRATDGRTTSATITVVVKRPNIVVVMADDQTAEQQRFLTRTNQLIGGQGTTFADMVVSYSECCPSRSTFLTGQYAHNHKVLSSALPTGAVTALKDGDTLATRLQAAGYHTSLAGKYLNDYGDPNPLNPTNETPTPVKLPSYVPPGWSDWYALVEPNGYNYFDYDTSDNGTVVHHGSRPEDYSTDVLFGRAEQNIRTRGGTATPLFMFVTPTAPHVMIGSFVPKPAPRHQAAFPTEKVPRTPAYNQADVSKMPSWIRDAPLLDADKLVSLDEVYRVGARSLLAVDEGVERLYQALLDKGELDNTLFVYTSDNGYRYGDHRSFSGKSDQYEETLRVPLLVRGPGFPAGRTAGQPVANIDLAPTLAATAKVDLGRTADGVALHHVAQDATWAAGRTVVIENGPLWGRRTYTGVRDNRWTYIESSNGEKELYDRKNDPYETVNRYGDPDMALAQYSGAVRTNQLKECAGGACHLGTG